MIFGNELFGRLQLIEQKIFKGEKAVIGISVGRILL